MSNPTNPDTPDPWNQSPGPLELPERAQVIQGERFAPWQAPETDCRDAFGCVDWRHHFATCQCSVCIVMTLNRIRWSRRDCGPLAAWIEHELETPEYFARFPEDLPEQPADESPGPDVGRPTTAL